MPRIAGVNIPENKRIEISLTYIYGIGRSLSRKILDELKIDINKKASALNPKEVNDLKEFIEKKINIDYNNLFLDIQKRDHDDSNRSISPLKPAPGAVIIDTTTMTREDVLKTISSHIDLATQPSLP